MDATIHIDGAARGNPGPAAFAFVISTNDNPDIEENGRLGITTNNVAEYTALLRALERAGSLGAKQLIICSDSELLVKQMNGEYKVKNEGLKPLYHQAKQLAGQFEGVSFHHVFREQNKRADQLCNDALDGMSIPLPPSQGPAGSSKRKPKEKTKIKTPQKEAVSEEAIQCLKTVASCWAGGNPNMPSPQEVWSQLWSIL
ncbi:MAG TPA: ribonuclease HI family protein, partial [Gemmataceae bacterium]|nr:ribonuclease HI family protein [Gemmataceae bacterium]